MHEPSSREPFIFHDARIFKAGNSLAVRIPYAAARAMEIENGSTVEIAVENGVLAIRKGVSRELQSLIERITPDNIHEEEFDVMLPSERW